MSELETAVRELVKRHGFQDDITLMIGQLADWQESLESGPDDDADEWDSLLKKVCETQRLLREINDYLYSLPVEPVLWEQVYG